MIPKSLKSFMFNLTEATSDGRLEWSEGAPEAYYCIHKNYNLHLSHFFNEDIGQSSFRFRITQNNKESAFSVTDEEDDFNMMQNLYSSVSVNANDFDSIAENFFD